MTNKLVLALVGTILIAFSLIFWAEQGCMARRDYGRSVGCWLARGVVETLAPQAR